MAEKEKTINITNLILVILLVAAAFLIGTLWKDNKNQKTGSATPTQTEVQNPEDRYPKTVGNFLVTEKEICKENDKPLVYFFGTTTCPHCTWEKPVIQKAASLFRNEISYHENIDSQTDNDVFEQYKDINPGYVPFLVLGCKYVRTGSGETAGEVQEGKDLTAIICKLTNNKPEAVCSSVKDLVDQIN